MLIPPWVAERHHGLAARVTAVLVAAAAVLAPVPAVVATIATAIAVGAVVPPLAARRGGGTADTVLVATGGTLIVLLLTGLGLALSGLPLTGRTWAPALAVIATVALVHLERSRPAGDVASEPVVEVTSPRTDRPSRMLSAWLAAAGVIVAAAIAVSVHATQQASATPLELSAGRTGVSSAQVLISVDYATGPLELRITSAEGRSHGYPVPSLAAGGSVRIPVTVPAGGRTTITVNNPGQSQPVRTLYLDGE